MRGANMLGKGQHRPRVGNGERPLLAVNALAIGIYAYEVVVLVLPGDEAEVVGHVLDVRHYDVLGGAAVRTVADALGAFAVEVRLPTTSPTRARAEMKTISNKKRA
jgi:hypothetical protein